MYLGRESLQDRRNGSRYLGKEASVGILVVKGPAKRNLLDLGFGKACPHDQLPDAPRIFHSEDARCLGMGCRDLAQTH